VRGPLIRKPISQNLFMTLVSCTRDVFNSLSKAALDMTDPVTGIVLIKCHNTRLSTFDNKCLLKASKPFPVIVTDRFFFLHSKAFHT